MGVLGRVAAATVTIPFDSTDHEQVSLAFGTQTTSGISLGPEGAMHVSAVYGAVSIIGETTGALPLHMYEDIGERGKRRAPEHELQELLHDQPNRYQTALEFREMMTAFALLRARGIAEQRRAGRRLELVPLHPDQVTREWLRDGTERYVYSDPLKGGEQRTLLPEDLFILRGRFGKSVLDYARDSFGLALQQDRYAAALFARGARPSGALKHKALLSDKARRTLRKALDEYAVGGDNAGRPLLLEEGMEWQSIGLTNKDAEFLESRKFSVSEIARWFRVPPHKLQDLDRATNNNIELQSLEFVVDTMLPWCERWEQSIRRDLIVVPGRPTRYFAEHQLDGLLRGDSKSRAEAYAIAIQWGWMAPNEARARENMNPYAGGDLFMRPLNMELVGGPAASRALAYIDGQTGRVVSFDDQTKIYLRALVRDGSSRALRKETAAIAKLAERTDAQGPDWTEGVTAFYREHAEFVGKLLHVPDEAAQQYALARCEAVLNDGPAAAIADESAQTELTELALQRSAPLQLTTQAA